MSLISFLIYTFHFLDYFIKDLLKGGENGPAAQSIIALIFAKSYVCSVEAIFPMSCNQLELRWKTAPLLWVKLREKFWSVLCTTSVISDQFFMSNRTFGQRIFISFVTQIKHCQFCLSINGGQSTSFCLCFRKQIR